MTPCPAIHLAGVEKRYGRHRVLVVESLTLPLGGCVIVTGMNGSGKSTLLRLVAGVSVPERGLVRREPALARLGLGYVPQAGGLYDELTVRENLALRRRLWRLPAAEVTESWYVDALGLAPFLDKTPGQLSGGFQRLATVAAALHVDPEWLLLDEPFYSVDATRRTILAEKLAGLADRLALLIIAAPAADDFPRATTVIKVDEGRVTCEAR